MDIVRVENLNFSYGKNPVLENVSFNIKEGDYVGIVGPNGSAKSTLMKLILGLLKKDSGSIRLFDKDLEDFKSFEKIGYISQNVRDFNRMFPATVEEIVSLNLDRNQAEDLDRALRVVKMENFKKRKIGDLSGGQKQRVFIARAIVNRPVVLFMDEPLVGVDLKSEREFYSLMDRLNKDYDMTLVMISHDIDRIYEKANKLLCLNEGQLFSHSTRECECIDRIKGIYDQGLDILLNSH